MPTTNKRKILLYVLPISLALVLAGGLFYLDYRIQDTLNSKTWINEVIKSRTNGKYTFNEVDFDLNIWTRSANAQNIILTPVSPDSSSNHVELFVPSASISIASYFKLLFNKQLEITSVVINNPEVRIKKNRQSERKKLVLEVDEIYSIISNYLAILKISNFDLNSGKFIYDSHLPNKRSYEISDLDLFIKNFRLDSSSFQQSASGFFAESVEINLKNQYLNMKDGIHLLSFDKLSSITKDGVITLDNFQVKPMRSVIDTLPTDAEFNIYDFTIPKVRIKGIDFISANRNDQLNIAEISITDPILHYETYDRDTLRDLNNRNSGRVILESLFDDILVKNFNIDHGQLKLVFHDTDKTREFQVPDFSIHAKNFHMDTSSYTFNPSYHYLDQFEIEINNYESHTDDSTYQYSLTSLRIDSKNRSIELDSFRIVPLDNDLLDNGLNILLPKVELSSIDIIQSIQSKHLDMGVLTITDPDVFARAKRSSTKDTTQSKNSPFKYLQFVDLDGIVLNKADLDLKISNELVSIKNMDISGSNFYFDQTTLDSLDLNTLLKKLDLRYDYASISNEDLRLRMENAHINSQDGNFYAEKLRYVPKVTDRNHFPMELNRIKISGMDLNALERKKQIKFDTLAIDNANLTVNTFKKGETGEKPKFKPGYWLHNTLFHVIQFKEIDAVINSNGKEVALAQNIDLRLNEFYYDSLKEEFFTDINLNVDSFSTTLDDIQHQLTASDIRITQNDSAIDIRGVSIHPLDSTLSNQFIIDGQEIYLKGTDIHRLINNQQVYFRRGFVLDPNIVVKVDSRKAKNDSSSVNGDFRNKLSYDLFEIQDANIDAEVITADDTLQFYTKDLSINAHHYNQFRTDDDHLFYARHLEVDIKNLGLSSTKINNDVLTGSITANTVEGQLEVSDIQFNLDQNLKADVHNLAIDGLEFKSLRRSQGLIAESISITEPNVRYVMPDKKDEEQSEDFKLALPKSIPFIELGSFAIQNAEVEIIDNQLNLGKPVNLDDLSLSLESIYLDSTWTFDSWKVDNKNLKLSIGSLQYDLNDSLTFFHFDQLNYDQSQQRLIIEGAGYGNRDDKPTLVSKIPYQKTWLDISTDQVSIDGVNLLTALQKEQIVAKSITVSGLNVFAHRDKRIPFDPNQKRGMPSYGIQRLKTDLKIDTIMVDSDTIEYSEYAKDGLIPGYLYFNDVRAGFGNMTNRAEILNQNPTMTFHGQGFIQGKGKFVTDVDFDLTDSLGFYSMTGRLGNMDLTSLNGFMEQAASVQIKSGVNKVMDWKFTADENVALGSMNFYYDDLKLNVLKHDEQDAEKIKNKSLLTFFANTFVVNKRNPKYLVKREGDIFLQRDKQRAIFNYWAKALLSGVVSSVGAKNNKKEMKKYYKSVGVEAAEN